MIHVIWEFRAKAEKVREFERDYSSSGAWARLFRRSPGYKESVLARDANVANRYIVIDVWESRSSYEAFKDRFSEEYEKLDRRCQSLTDEENPIGVFERI